MKPRWNYLIKPCGETYNNKKKIADKDFIVNTSIEDASFVNRLGHVCAAPKGGQIPVGSIVVVHHNVFRTYLDMKGRKRKSNEYFRDNQYLVDPDKIYMYDNGEGWKTTKEYCFISPIEYIQDDKIYRSDKQKEEHVGIVKHSSIYPEGTKVGFSRNSEYEFTIDDKKVYRMKNTDICLMIS